jgi:hypothetical protein
LAAQGPLPDWAAPWFAPYRRLGLLVQSAWQGGAPLPEALNQVAVAQGAACRFAAQVAPVSAACYEQMIATTGVVPTRDNWHDFFNGLVWLHFADIKRRLNALQVDAIARQVEATSARRSGHRGALRDALTIFDENAVFLGGASASLLDDLVGRRWRGAFEARAAQWQGVAVEVFGHALLDQLRQPRMNLTGHLWLGSRIPVADELLCKQLRTPLVLMGIPGWAAHAGLRCDLGDLTVFRPEPSSAVVSRRR